MSLMNGLSAAGAGLAQFAGTAGLELQKQQLANQSAILADQLATTRESTLQGQQQTFQAGQTEKQQTFQASQSTQAQQAEMARVQAGEAGAMARTQATINAPPETVKLLKALGVPLPNGAPPSDGGTTPAAPTPSGGTPPAMPGPRASQVTPATADATTPTPTATPSADLTSNPLVAKALGLPMPGSEDAIRRAIATDVAADPQFKYKSAGAQGAETEHRLSIAKAQIGTPEALAATAKAIANYQYSPQEGRAIMMAGGPEVTQKIFELNPNYNATNYDAVKETQKAIAFGGSLSVPILAMNTSMGHAAHFLDVAQQLGNYSGGNWANFFPNKLAENTGQQPLVNALKQTAFAMAEEGNKIYAGNAGTETAIDHWYQTFPSNGSLADQVVAIKNFAQLMGDKFDTMTYQVNQTLGKAGLPSAELLFPKAAATYQRLTSMGSDGKPVAGTPAPAASTPAVPSVGAVMQGYKFLGGDPSKQDSWQKAP